MSISRCLALAGCLLALHAPSHAQIPPPSAAFSFLGRTPDSGLTSWSVLGSGGQDFCRDSATVHINLDVPNIYELVCGWIGIGSDQFQVFAYNNTLSRQDDTPGQYWLYLKLGGYMRVLTLGAGPIRTPFWGHAAAWAKDGIMFRAHEVIQVKIDSHDARPQLWIERCDAGGCTSLDQLNERPLPWTITLPANRPPKQPTANPPVNSGLESEYYRVQATHFVEANGLPGNFVENLDDVHVQSTMNVLVSIHPACVPGTAGC